MRFAQHRKIDCIDQVRAGLATQAKTSLVQHEIQDQFGTILTRKDMSNMRAKAMLDSHGGKEDADLVYEYGVLFKVAIH